MLRTLPFCACGTKPVSCELQRASGAIKCFLKHFIGVQYDSQFVKVSIYTELHYRSEESKRCVRASPAQRFDFTVYDPVKAVPLSAADSLSGIALGRIIDQNNQVRIAIFSGL